MRSPAICSLLLFSGFACGVAAAQPYGAADQGEPGDAMIQRYLARETDKIHQQFLSGVTSLEDWQSRHDQRQQEYFHMLGLWPLPEKTPLQDTVTGTYAGDGFVVEKLHYQSRPGLYVTANLYRPPHVEQGTRLPTVLYVCGHSHRGRDGNKTAYQSHGIWFARHGYVCLMLDTLQLGEIPAIHHGTYREQRWWWHSRGYTPAGVECWNGLRGVDYLISRPDVDPERIAVTGISGGGAATFWIAAADERVAVAVPVSGMADLPSYVCNRTVNGHCDCMFPYNTFRWPWTRFAALIAPRPMLFVNSDADAIFPMDANERVINRLERLYSLYGAGDMVDSLVSIGGHAYRADIRRAAYRFLNLHLKGDPRPVQDSERDLVSGPRSDPLHPIPPEKLRVFAHDDDVPDDQLNTSIDRHFVPLADPDLPREGQFGPWRSQLIDQLRRVCFGYFPDRIPPARLVGQMDDPETCRIETEDEIQIPLRKLGDRDVSDPPGRVLLWIAEGEGAGGAAQWARDQRRPGDVLYQLSPRGVGPTRWTRRNPPNYVERAHVLLGRTVDSGRVWDAIAAAGYLRGVHAGAEVYVLGDGSAALVAAYAALWDDALAGAMLRRPPMTHMDSDAPRMLNVLRVCDVPHILGMIAPRPLSVDDCTDQRLQTVAAIYAAAGAKPRFQAVR